MVLGGTQLSLWLNHILQIYYRYIGERRVPPNLDTVFNPRTVFRLFIAPPIFGGNKSTILNNARLLCIPSLGISATERQNNGRKHG